MRLPLLCLLLTPCVALADTPQLSYVFPAGGRRGTKTPVRVGGLNLYRSCGWELRGTGVRAEGKLTRTDTRRLEGPMLPLPDSQRQENYPQDMTGTVAIDAAAVTGTRCLRVWTSEGASSGSLFMVGDLPEVIEDEREDGLPIRLTLPVTANGRIYPRENIDRWVFRAKKGVTVTAEVHAARLRSPLDARVEIRGPDGAVVADMDDTRGTDPVVTFVAPADGDYVATVQDASRIGSQSHVYRLTLTEGPRVVGVFPAGGNAGSTVKVTARRVGAPDVVENVPLPATPGVHTVRVAGTDVAMAADTGGFDGVIERPGVVRRFAVAAKKGVALRVALHAKSLGSPLRGVLTLLDTSDKPLATSDSNDGVLTHTPAADGTLTLEVRDRFPRRGGPAFVFRASVAEDRDDFALTAAVDAISLTRGGTAKVKVVVRRTGSPKGEIRLAAKDLPAGVKMTPEKIAAGQNAVELTFAAAKDAPVGPVRVRVEGAVGDITRPMTFADDVEPTLLLGVGVAPPFKIVGTYDLRLAARGGVFRKTYRVEREPGFTGPLEVRLADKQSRHLQGVSGPVLTVPAGVDTFDYPVSLPPWMEIGRTSRACVMAVGTVVIDGVAHETSYSSQGQNEQLIAVVETGRLGVEVTPGSIAAEGPATLTVRVRRGKELTGAVRLEMLSMEGAKGVTASPVTIAAGKDVGEMRVSFGKGGVPPRVLIRATTEGPDGPARAEAPVELVRD